MDFNELGTFYLVCEATSICGGIVATSQEIEIEGWLDGSYKYGETITVNKTRTKYDFDFDNIDTLYIVPDEIFAMDDMTVTPEPVSTVLFLVGGLPFAASLYRKRKE